MRLRAVAILTGLALFTLPLMPVQAVLLRVNTRWARRFPHWYHRNVCRALGIDLQITGSVARDTPVLLVANHVSWLDIPVISAVAPVSFVAKKEVGSWPFVSILANLQRTVFVDRERRTKIGDTANEITSRLASGDAIVLFAEGTSNDGNRVLPFRSALVGAAGVDRRRNWGHAAGPAARAKIEVRSLALVYTHLHGMPLDRFQRPAVAWYGDMELPGHVWALLKNGPLDVHVRIGAPVPLDAFADRKALALQGEREVRRAVVALLRHADAGERRKEWTG